MSSLGYVIRNILEHNVAVSVSHCKGHMRLQRDLSCFTAVRCPEQLPV